MTDPLPDWLRQTPNLPSLHNLPNVPWGGYNPKDVALPSLPDLDVFVRKLIEKFLSQVVLAFTNIFVPGELGAAFDQLKDWADNLGDQLVAFINSNAGINLASWDDFLASLDDGKGIDLPVVVQVLSALQSLFDGIDFTAPDFDPADALEAFAAAMKPLLDLTAKLRGLIDISWLTNDHQNLVDESGYDDPATVVVGDDPSITHDATDGVPGSTPLGCLKFTLDGVDHERGGELIAVGPGWELKPESRVKWESVSATASANAIRLELQPYLVVGDTATPVGGRVLVGAVASPSGSSGGTGGWGTTISGEYDVPDDGSVSHVALFPRVTSAGTAGFAKFDNTKLFATQDIPQEFIKDLLADLQSLLDWITAWVDNGLAALGIPPIGSLFDKINDLADGLSEIQDSAEDAIAGLADKLGIDEWDDWLADAVGGWQALLNKFKGGAGGTLDDITDALEGAGQSIRDAIANALGHSGSGHTSANILTYLQNIPQTVVQNLEDDFADAGDAIADVFDDVRDGWNSLWAGLWKAVSASGKTASDVQSAAAATSDLITQVSSTAARLDAAVSQVIRGGGGGATDQFEREDTDLGDDWDSTNTGAGAIATNGSAAYWEPSGGSAATQIARNVNVETATNWQKVSFVLTEPLNTTSGWLLLGRMNAARDTYVYMFVKKDYREIGYVTSGGSPNILASSSDPYDPPPGHKVEAHFGDTLLTNEEDTFWLPSPSRATGISVTSTAPAKGASNRNMGLGARVASVSGAQVSPGVLELWTGGDSKSPPTVGVYLEATRNSLTDGYAPLTSPSGFNAVLPSGFLYVTRQTDWISFDASTTTITVELPGAYSFWATVSLDGTLPASNTFEILDQSSGIRYLQSPRLMPGESNTVQMSGVKYLEAGDSIQLRYTATGTSTKNAVGEIRIAKLSPPYFA